MDRSKKLSRQLKKSLSCADIDTHLPEISEWLEQQANYPQNLKPLTQNMGKFLDTIDTAYEQYERNLEQAQRSLELSGKEVEERNRQLRVENRKVSNLLNNMRQAVFTVDGDRTVVSPVSKYTESIFGRDITGEKIFESLYSTLDEASEQRSNLETALISIYGEDSLQWDLMEEYFPRKVHVEGKSLKVAVNPIFDDSEALERVMYIVEDVTEVERLEREMHREREKSERQIQAIQKLIAHERQQIQQFLRESLRLAEMIQEQGPEHDTTIRHLHTLKGNARLYGLEDLSQQVHIAEDRALENDGFEGFFTTNVCSLLDWYVDIATRLLGIDLGTSTGPLSLSKLLLPHVNDAQSIAQERGLDLTIEVDELEVEEYLVSAIQDCCMHVMRNAVDHGLSGKKEGRIHVQGSQNEEFLQITVSDNGSGINLDKLFQCAQENGILENRPSDQEVLDLIFHTGLSTKDEVSCISGRGVGMDGVRELTREFGGDTKVMSSPGKGTSFELTFYKKRLEKVA